MTRSSHMGLGCRLWARRTGYGAAAARSPADEALYRQFHPYYAELCALSEIRKKPGFGAPLQSGMGGHSLLYLNGVRLDRTVRYPTLSLIESDAAPGQTGVGISVNSHYRNANWIGTEGEEFFWRGALAPGEALTREAYERTQHRAKAMGILDAIEFHPHLFRDKPPGMSERDYMYEISVATDYGVRFGRDLYRVRVPLDRARMASVVRYLNDLNAPYRDGAKIFRWRVLNNNCSHVAHNALAAAGLWSPWPTGEFFMTAAFRFPVPKNEFVDLALRANDLPIGDADAIFADAPARRALIETGALPTAPGALVTADRAIGGNEVYETENLRLIFYDNPFWGPYHPRFVRLLSEPRYSDLRANLRHFADLYAAARTNAPPPAAASGERAGFHRLHRDHIECESAKVNDRLSRLDPIPAFEAAS